MIGSQAFRRAFSITMKHEGAGLPDNPTGLVNDRRDPGGLTQWGLSKRANPDLPIGKMNEAQAMQVYLERYWRNLDLVTDPAVSGEIFDTAVNMGFARAVRIAQEVAGLLERAYKRPQPDVDGRLGPQTAAVLNYWSRRDRDALLALLNVTQGREYLEIIQANPTMIYALRSWARRCLPEMRAA